MPEPSTLVALHSSFSGRDGLMNEFSPVLPGEPEEHEEKGAASSHLECVSLYLL